MTSIFDQDLPRNPANFAPLSPLSPLVRRPLVRVRADEVLFQALVQMAATHIENGLLAHQMRRCWVLAIHPRPEFLATLSAGLLAWALASSLACSSAAAAASCAAWSAGGAQAETSRVNAVIAAHSASTSAPRGVAAVVDSIRRTYPGEPSGTPGGRTI